MLSPQTVPPANRRIVLVGPTLEGLAPRGMRDAPSEMAKCRNEGRPVPPRDFAPGLGVPSARLLSSPAPLPRRRSRATRHVTRRAQTR